MPAGPELNGEQRGYAKFNGTGDGSMGVIKILDIGLCAPHLGWWGVVQQHGIRRVAVPMKDEALGRGESDWLHDA